MVNNPSEKCYQVTSYQVSNPGSSKKFVEMKLDRLAAIPRSQ